MPISKEVIFHEVANGGSLRGFREPGKDRFVILAVPDGNDYNTTTITLKKESALELAKAIVLSFTEDADAGQG